MVLSQSQIFLLFYAGWRNKMTLNTGTQIAAMLACVCLFSCSKLFELWVQRHLCVCMMSESVFLCSVTPCSTAITVVSQGWPTQWHLVQQPTHYTTTFWPADHISGLWLFHLTVPHFGSRHGNWSSFQSSEVQPLAISCCFLEEAKYKSKTSKSQS